MLSLAELERAGRVLDAEWRGARLDKLVEPGSFELVLHLSGGEAHGPKQGLFLLLSWRPKFGRVAALPRPRKAPERPPALAQYVKPRLEGARLREVVLRGADRQLALRFEARDGARMELLLSLMGLRSNLYVLEQGEVIARTARPLSDTRRDLKLGEAWRDPEGAPAPKSEDRFAEVEDSELLAAIQAEYGLREDREQEDRLRHQLAQALKKQRAALERKARSLAKDAEAEADAPKLERWGELLKGNLKRVGKKASEVQVEDFETGATVEIPLDPKLDATGNMELLFKRSRKAMKKGVRAAQDMEALEERRRALDGLQAELEAVGEEDEEALRALAERPDVARLLDRYLPKARTTGPAQAKPRKVWKLGKRELPTRLVPKCYKATGGLEIWVGKNDSGNDMLTTRLARGRDLFFHLEGSPGSHVILRVEKGEPPQEALLEAAELAVQFSKQKNATRAPVHVAECKDISKPKGAKPGLVYVHRGRTIQLRRDPERLKRITAARIDD
ncbi:MAG: DUF814 domain-containing protein [bacterium]|nr:DUF814 domain-containing protein [bacterium]